jgi:hypothetical protein
MATICVNGKWNETDGVLSFKLSDCLPDSQVNTTLLEFRIPYPQVNEDTCNITTYGEI